MFLFMRCLGDAQVFFFVFFFNHSATTDIYTSLHTLSLHDALPIFFVSYVLSPIRLRRKHWVSSHSEYRSEEHTSELQSRNDNSYAVFCLKKKKVELRHEMTNGWNEVAGRCSNYMYDPGFVIQTNSFFFFNYTATTEIYTSLHTLSLHDALPISPSQLGTSVSCDLSPRTRRGIAAT